MRADIVNQFLLVFQILEVQVLLRIQILPAVWIDVSPPYEELVPVYSYSDFV